MDNNNTFSYNYSSSEQKEIKEIRKKYEPQEESKLERIRKLDNRATAMAQTVSLIFGVLGILILGLGMSLAMSDLGDILGQPEDIALLIGATIGVIGGAIAAAAYPMYSLTLSHARKKIAPEIIRLTDELMK